MDDTCTRRKRTKRRGQGETGLVTKVDDEGKAKERKGKTNYITDGKDR